MAFNAFKYIDELREAGVPDEQAEAQIKVLSAAMENELATKHDMELVKYDLELVRKDIETIRADLKRDIKELELKINNVGKDIKELELKINNVGKDIKELELKINNVGKDIKEDIGKDIKALYDGQTLKIILSMTAVMAALFALFGFVADMLKIAP